MLHISEVKDLTKKETQTKLPACKILAVFEQLSCKNKFF